MNYTDLIRYILPPIIIDGIRYIKIIYLGDYGIIGDYSSWSDAQKVSVGYESDIILQKTKGAIMKVNEDISIYERDSVLMDKPEYIYQTLTGLMRAAAQDGGELNVLDFGGSLGSTYYHNRKFLQGLFVRWNIIEQPGYVKVGKELFQDDILKFYNTIEECMAQTEPNVILLGSTLQYLENPYEILNELMDQNINHIIIDRTPFWDGPTDKICIENVPPEIYPGSYPMWVFSGQKFLDFIIGNKNKYQFVVDYQISERMKSQTPIIWKGMILEKSD